MFYWNVGHHFKLTFGMHLAHAQFKTKNQVFDYLSVSIPALKINAVTNIHLDSSEWRSDIVIYQRKLNHR